MNFKELYKSNRGITKDIAEESWICLRTIFNTAHWLRSTNNTTKKKIYLACKKLWYLTNEEQIDLFPNK